MKFDKTAFDDATLTVGARTTPQGPLLALTGDVDLNTVPILETALASAIREAPADALLTLDLRAVRYIDSAGLAVLVRARKRLAPAGELHLHVAPSSQPDRVLRLGRLDALMPLTYAAPG